jgi:hypothetical protein
MSDWRSDAEPRPEDLFDELLEAHLDTIELAHCGRMTGWDDHVEYLQRLVRHAKHFAAVAAELRG